ncbi:MAG: hypothetical protein QW568_04810 [Candidatus Anstonellaceae archaeon]
MTTITEKKVATSKISAKRDELLQTISSTLKLFDAMKSKEDVGAMVKTLTEIRNERIPSAVSANDMRRLREINSEVKSIRNFARRHMGKSNSPFTRANVLAGEDAELLTSGQVAQLKPRK